MQPLFCVAPLTDVMRADLASAFEVHHTDDMADPLAWLDQNGAGVRYVLTDGHYGLRQEYLDRLPDLRLISSNGVGYDAIDVDVFN